MSLLDFSQKQETTSPIPLASSASSLSNFAKRLSGKKKEETKPTSPKVYGSWVPYNDITGAIGDESKAYSGPWKKGYISADIAKEVTYAQAQTKGSLSEKFPEGIPSAYKAALPEEVRTSGAMIRAMEPEEMVSSREKNLPEEESKMKDIWDAFRVGGKNISHQTQNYFISTLPNQVFADIEIPKGAKSNDIISQPGALVTYTAKQAKERNAKNEKLRDDYKKRYISSQDQYQTWTNIHPELKPRAGWDMSVREALKSHPDLLKDPGYWGYIAGKTASFSIAVGAVTLGVGFATGNPYLALAAGMAVATPMQSQDLYEDLVENGATDQQAANLATVIGPMIASIEVLGDLPFLKAVGGSVFGKILTTNIRKEVTKKTLASLLKKGVATFTKIEIAEAVEEVLQLAIQNATVRTVNENREILEGMTDTVLETLMATAPLALLGGGADIRQDTSRQALPTGTKEQVTTEPFTERIGEVSEQKTQAVEPITTTPEAREGVIEPIKAKEGVIPQELETAITKAKAKGLSAEEFIDTQIEVYHGSPIPLKSFSNKKGGVFFTDEYADATGFAGTPDNVYEGYLDFKKPLVIDAKGAKWDGLNTKYGESTQEVIGNAEGEGYDGVIFKNVVDNIGDTAGIGGQSTIYYAYKPQNSFINKSQLTDIYNQAKTAGKEAGVAKSIEAKAIKRGITEQFEGLAEYSPVVIKEQVAKIGKLMETDIERAKKMATGVEPLDSDIKGAMLVKMMEDYAMENKDGDFILELAKSPLVTATSEAGQTLRLIRERTPDSATAMIKDVQNVREEVAKKRRRGRTKTQEKSKIKKSLDKKIEQGKKKISKYSWDNLLKEIAC